MPAIYIPTMLQSLSGGVKRVDVRASTVWQVVDELERLYPGMKERLIEDGGIIPSVSVSVDGEISRVGLLEKVGEESEVHFVPAIGGGAWRTLQYDVVNLKSPPGAPVSVVDARNRLTRSGSGE